jgi:hypothetical protein
MVYLTMGGMVGRTTQPGGAPGTLLRLGRPPGCGRAMWGGGVVGWWGGGVVGWW